MINVLELFAGSRSIGRAAEALGMNVYSVDWQPFDGINLIMDVEELEARHIPFVPDVVWASPDCATYSVAAISRHREGVHPKSDYAKKCDKVNKHFLELIDRWQNVNPDMVYFVENPRGMLRKMPFMLKLPRHTIWYCQYGDERAKPTDIWTNSKKWIPRPECHNGNKQCHHLPAPRGSQVGTQGLKDSVERSKIPESLCIEILKSCMQNG